MRTESFMKIEATGQAVPGPSNSVGHPGEIELLSFEHLLQRDPTRSSENKENIERLNRIRAGRETHGGPLPSQGREHTSTAKLASNLRHFPITVLKLVDQSSASLYHWATDTTLLTSVTLSIRMLVKSGATFEMKDLLTVKVLNAFISEMDVVGSYPCQPWLNINTDLWASGQRLDVGPIERIVFSYEKIEWSVEEKLKFKWDRKFKVGEEGT
jgi:type VI protein secretion system component Hcp